MESKPADVFAFGMFAVEVFTGKIPFKEHKNEAVVLRISQGGRPEMPENAQAVGLTNDMWRVLEDCWQQNPKKRPTMEEVAKRWQKFVEYDNNGNNLVTEYVQITLVICLRFRSQLSVTHLGDNPRQNACRTLADLGQRPRPLGPGWSPRLLGIERGLRPSNQR